MKWTPPVKGPRITHTRSTSIFCDGEGCDFTWPVANKISVMASWIHRPCPKCGRNLLSRRDFLAFVRTQFMIAFDNLRFYLHAIFHPEVLKGPFLRIHRNIRSDTKGGVTVEEQDSTIIEKL